MNTNSILYSLRVWLTSVFLAPLVFVMVETFKNQSYQPGFAGFISEKATEYLGCVIFGGIFSFFTWVIFILIIKGLITALSGYPQLKMIIVITGVLLSAGTFAVFLPESFRFYNEFFYLMSANCMCIGGGAWFYKLEIGNEADAYSN
jgi:hypothetical protein